jgi:hypothetical protein
MDRSNKPDDTDQYGDLVLWLQLLDHAKGEERPIILVTDDAKEDWWREVRGERLGPRPELVHEFMAATGGGKWFYMYSTEQFLKYAKEYLDADVKPEAIKEAEGIEEQDAEQERIRVTGEVIRETQQALRAVQEEPLLGPSIGGLRLPLSELAIPRMPQIDFLKGPKIDIPQVPKFDIPRIPEPFVPRIPEIAIPNIPDFSKALRPILEQQSAIERVAAGLSKMLAMQERMLNPFRGLGGSGAQASATARSQGESSRTGTGTAQEEKKQEGQQQGEGPAAGEQGSEAVDKPAE